MVETPVPQFRYRRRCRYGDTSQNWLIHMIHQPDYLQTHRSAGYQAWIYRNGTTINVFT